MMWLLAIGSVLLVLQFIVVPLSQAHPIERKPVNLDILELRCAQAFVRQSERVGKADGGWCERERERRESEREREKEKGGRGCLCVCVCVVRAHVYVCVTWV